MSSLVLSVDSGLGGLSVLEHIRRQCPDARHVYLCDNAFYPYGLRADAELVAHFLTAMKAAMARHPPDIVVVACNTISTICLPQLRAIAKAPVVGVVPAIKPAAALSQRRRIGLLATPATINRPYTDRLIAEFAADCEVIRVGSAELVDMAEAKLRGIEPDCRAIASILSPFFDRPDDRRPDVIVMACTHFPLLMDELAACGPGSTRWIDSGEAIARRVRQLLHAPAEDSPSRDPDIAIVTGDFDLKLRDVFRSRGFPITETLLAA